MPLSVTRIRHSTCTLNRCCRWIHLLCMSSSRCWHQRDLDAIKQQRKLVGDGFNSLWTARTNRAALNGRFGRRMMRSRAQGFWDSHITLGMRMYLLQKGLRFSCRMCCSIFVLKDLTSSASYSEGLEQSTSGKVPSSPNLINTRRCQLITSICQYHANVTNVQSEKQDETHQQQWWRSYSMLTKTSSKSPFYYLFDGIKVYCDWQVTKLTIPFQSISFKKSTDYAGEKTHKTTNTKLH